VGTQIHSDHHHFTHSRNEAISGNNSWSFSEIDKENIHSYSGAVIDKYFVKTFSCQVEKEEPYVFAIIGNNLCRGLGDGHPKESRK
jgi:hypothetical protein